MIYYEPVNLKHWNMFKEVPGPGHVESFYGVKDMSLGDIVLLHVGSQDGRYESGIYAFGEVVGDPYLDNDPKDMRYGKYRIDVKFNTIVRNKPLIGTYIYHSKRPLKQAIYGSYSTQSLLAKYVDN